MDRPQLRLTLARASPVAYRGDSELKAESLSSHREPKTRLGRLEYYIVSYAFENGLRRLTPSDVARSLKVDRRRALDALRRLEARGLARRVSRGLYELALARASQGQDEAATQGQDVVGPANKSTSTSLAANKGPSPGSDLWLGPLEYRIVSYAFENGLRYFTLSELSMALGARPWSVRHALRRLEARGAVRRTARGLYEMAEDPARLVALPVRDVVGRQGQDVVGSANKSPKAGQGTRGPARARPTVSPASRGPAPIPLYIDGPRFDNVRGYTYSGSYVGGDRGRALYPEDLVRFRSVSYAEVQFVFRGLGELPGEVVAYTNRAQDGPDSFRVEFRPRRGYVKRNGVASATRLAYVAVARVAYAASYLTMTRAPPDVARWLRRQLSPLIGCAASESSLPYALAPS